MIRCKFMQKIGVMLLVLLLLTGLCVLPAAAAEVPELTCSSVIVAELTSGTTLLSQEPDAQIVPGSVVKVISLYVLCSKCFTGEAELRDDVTITADMMHTENSKIPVKEDEVLKYQDLLYMMFMDYSRTAAAAAAIHAVGSEENLVDEMNAFAESCGCENTHFTDITGADEEGEYTTPSDLVRMLEAAVENSVFREIFAAKSYSIDGTNKSISRTLTTANLLQRTSSGCYCAECTGGRSGGFGDAYTTLSLSIDESSDMELIVIASGASKETSCQDAASLIRWTFDGYSWRTVLTADENVTEVPVDMGSGTDHVIAVPAEDVSVMLDNDIEADDFEHDVIIYSGEEGLTAPVEKGQIIGELHLLYEGKEYASTDLVAASPVDLARSQYLKRAIKETAGGAGVIIMLLVVAIMLGLYIVYAVSYRSYRLHKKSVNAAIKKRLREERWSGLHMKGSGAAENTRKLPAAIINTNNSAEENKNERRK